MSEIVKKYLLEPVLFDHIREMVGHINRCYQLKGEECAVGRPFEHILSMKQKSSPFLRSDTVFGF